MQIQIHQESGLSVWDPETRTVLYQDSLENALADAGISDFAWPDPQIVRVFRLADGRLASSRETAYGLQQSSAPLVFVELFNQLENQMVSMQSAQAIRQGLETEEL